MEIKTEEPSTALREERPLRVEIANAVLTKLMDTLSVTSEMRVMDYGCGTGLMSVPLSQNAAIVYAVESSLKQLDILAEKIENLDISNIETILCDLSKDIWPGEQVGLILTSMTMHHIADYTTVFERFNQILEKNGYLIIADLDKENGDFHKDTSSVAHYGFDREKLLEDLQTMGYERIDCQTVHQITKLDETGKERLYSMFFLVVRKGNEVTGI